MLRTFMDLGEVKGEPDLDEEAKEQGFLRAVKGVAMNAGRITDNGTLYPRAIVHREVAKAQKRANEGKLVALADHPSMCGPGEVMTVAGRWTHVSVDKDNDVRVAGGIVDTDGGRNVNGAMKGGIRIGLSSRGYGSVVEKEMDEEHPEWELNKDRKGEKFREVQDDFDLETPGDFVLRPSNKGAWTESEITEAFDRLDRARTRLETEQIDHEEDEDMKGIKTLAALREALDEESFAAIEGELMAKVEPDALARALEATAPEMERAVAEALADRAKVAEAIGVPLDVVEFAAANLEPLRALVEAEFNVAALVSKPAKPATEDEKDAQIKVLEGQIGTLREEMDALKTAHAEEQAERERAETELAEREQRDTLEQQLSAATLGMVAAELVVERARGKLELGATEEEVKQAVAEAKAYVEKVGAALQKPAGRGKEGAGAEGGEEPGETDVVTRRKAFEQQHPHLAGPGIETVVEAAIDRDRLPAEVLDEWRALYGPKALAQHPVR
uniref:Putative peptidase n=1 Tax=viral metagenome TaxID=1070528 RepID=A0A6M3MHE8_9ZZZZ